MLLFADVTSQQHTVYPRDGSAQTEIEVADQTCYFTQPQYIDTGQANSSADRRTPGAIRVASGVAVLKSSHRYDWAWTKVPLGNGDRTQACHSGGARLTRDCTVEAWVAVGSVDPVSDWCRTEHKDREGGTASQKIGKSR